MTPAYEQYAATGLSQCVNDVIQTFFVGHKLGVVRQRHRHRLIGCVLNVDGNF